MITPALRIEGLRADHGAGDDTVTAVDGVELTVDRGEFLSILGPSGCGKTTLLRAVAGLHRPRAGTIDIGDHRVFGEGVDVAAERREVGMVFQSLALWPHLTVAETVSFPLEVVRRRARSTAASRADRVHSVLETVGLAALADRPSTTLSGGQRQRLALARALITEPDVLLLDEPFSDLDAPLREATRLEVKLAQQRAGVTVVLVTHDQDEALSMSDRVAVMRGGRFLQTGTPDEVYHRPVDDFVAGFVGRSTLLSGRMRGSNAVETTLGTLSIRAARPGGPAVDAGRGNDVCVVIRPEDLALVGPDQPGAWPGVVETVQFRGGFVHALVRVGATSLVAQARADGFTATVAPGDHVHVLVSDVVATALGQPVDASAHGLEGEHLS